MAMRREMDPDNRFVSPYMARLLGIEVSVSEAYFAKLSDALTQAGIHQPALVLDLDRLNANIAAIKARLPKDWRFASSTNRSPCLQLLRYRARPLPRDRFMSFHLPISAEMLKRFPDRRNCCSASRCRSRRAAGVEERRARDVEAHCRASSG